LALIRRGRVVARRRLNLSVTRLIARNPAVTERELQPDTAPLARIGDTVIVHDPPLGTWRVDAVLRDLGGRFYYRISRGTRSTTIDAWGVDIIS
jgi:hypothetical protein